MRIFSYLLKAFLIIFVSLLVSSPAQAALTFDATSIVGDGALTLRGAIGSTITIGNTAQTGTIDIANSAGALTLNLGVGNSAKTLNLGTGTDIDTINIGTGATGVDVIRIGQAAADLALTDANWSITTAGLFTTADDIALNGGDLTTTAATLTIASTTSALTFNLGTGNSAKTFNLGTGVDIDTINIGTGATGVDVIRIGQAAADLALTDANWSISAAGLGTFLSLNLGGTTILDHLSGTATNLVSASVASSTCADYGTITVTGAATGDTVYASPDAASSATGIEDLNLAWNSVITSANTVTIRACNMTYDAINAGDDQEWRADVWQH